MSIHVVPRGDEWAVLVEGINQPESTHHTEDEALQAALALARDNATELVIHSPGGDMRAGETLAASWIPEKRD